MKRSVKNLLDYKFETEDRMEGAIKDFILDDIKWIIRYLEVSFGSLFKNQKVLVPRVFLEEPDWENHKFPVKLKKDTISRCPSIEEHETVSRAYEAKLSDYYGLRYYWMYGYAVPGVATFPPHKIDPPEKSIKEKDLNINLRSFKEIEGYHICAIDKKIGHIEDIIVDDKNWQIVYVAVDTSNWLPWSKKVVIPVNKLEEVSYTGREVTIKMNSEAIMNAPDYDQTLPFESEFENDVINFFNSSLMK